MKLTGLFHLNFTTAQRGKWYPRLVVEETKAWGKRSKEIFFHSFLELFLYPGNVTNWLLGAAQCGQKGIHLPFKPSPSALSPTTSQGSAIPSGALWGLPQVVGSLPTDPIRGDPFVQLSLRPTLGWVWELFPARGPVLPWVYSCPGQLNKSHVPRSWARPHAGNQDAGSGGGSAPEKPGWLLSWVGLDPAWPCSAPPLVPPALGPPVGPHPPRRQLGSHQAIPILAPLPDLHFSASPSNSKAVFSFLSRQAQW